MRHSIGAFIAIAAFAVPGGACAFLFLRDWWYDRDARRRIVVLLERERSER